MSINRDLDPFKFLDKPEPNFELTGREKRNADINDGVFKVGGAGIYTAATHYEFTGKHSLRTDLGDQVIEKPVTHQSQNPLHRSEKEF